MKYRIIAPALCVILAFVMSACTNTDMGSAGSVSGQRENTIIKGTENVTIQLEYHTEEINCTNGGEDIYGVAYIPDTDAAKYPLIIFSHELGNTHTSGTDYAEALAAQGIAV